MIKNIYQIKRGAAEVLVFICILLLTACSDKTDSELVQKGKETFYSAQSLSVELPDGFTPGKCFFTDDYFICTGWDKDSSQTKVFHIALADLKQAGVTENSAQDFF